MLQKQPTKPCYLYQQYRTDETMLKVFSLLDKYKTINYNYNQENPTNNNPQAHFYDLSPYSYYFLQCVYGFNYTIIASNVNQNYYDSNQKYDNTLHYDSQVNPLKTKFFLKGLYKRKQGANRIFTIADFIQLLLEAFNTKKQERQERQGTPQNALTYQDITIEFIKPRTLPMNPTNQPLWIIELQNIELEDFNLFISFLLYNKDHLPYGFNYKISPKLT